MDQDVIDILKFMGYTVLITLAVFYIGFAITNHMKFDARLAVMEQLRSDTHVERVNAEDVIGLAAESNGTLVWRQIWNSKWYADPLIPDGWDRVEPIKVAP